MDKAKGIYQVAACAVMLLAVTSFWIGYHSIDLSMNISNGSDCIDIGAFGNIADKESMYLLGVRQMVASLLFSMLSFLFLIACTVL